MSKPATAKTARSQWRLSTLLVFMLGFAVLFGGIANMRCVVEMKVSFQSLAANDEGLEAWLKQSSGVSNLSITRPDQQTVALRYTRPFYAVDIPKLPWKELGYGPLTSMVFTQGMSGSWWIPTGILLILFSGRIARCFHAIVSWLSRAKTSAPHPAPIADG